MQFSFILVEPSTPENVGASARALKTMGFSNLLLVNPCDHLCNPARWLAHGSEDILENAKIFETLKDALSGFDFVIGTSSKIRSVKYDSHPLQQLPDLLKSKGRSITKIAVVFGREESGLNNKELKLCDLITTAPMKIVFPSLNLSHAVMVFAWELSKIDVKELAQPVARNEESFRLLQSKIKFLLKEAGFKEDSAIFSRFLERINVLKEGDIHLLHSLCNKFPVIKE